MASLVWGEPGVRRFELGVDRGVLYPASGIGVVWNGLTGAKEIRSEGEEEFYYLDGARFGLSRVEEADIVEISAISYPEAFNDSLGNVADGRGLYFTGQNHEPFGLSYRTLLGNDIFGDSLGYKIHILYDAHAEVSEMQYSTLKPGSLPTAYTWTVKTLPQGTSGHFPVGHFVIDSTKVTPAALEALEDVLYGTLATDPELPSVVDLLTIFTL